MQADIAWQETDEVGVRVFDDENREHRLVLTADGTVDAHDGPDAIPRESAGRTDEQDRLIEAVQRRARYAVHWETDFDLVDPPWDPRVIRQGIDAIESLSAEEFERFFRETYRQLQSPPVDVPVSDVEVITQGIYLDDEGAVDDVTGVLIGVNPGGRGFEWSNPEAHSGPDADVSIELPPLEFDFPFGERFREYLSHHLKCQIRDIYHRMGEAPPEDCQLEGTGKMTAGT